MTKNILHYRAKGGKFRKTEDFKKIYGMTEDQYSVLSPYIHIPVSYTHLRAHETGRNLVCRLLLEKKKKKKSDVISMCAEMNVKEE